MRKLMADVIGLAALAALGYGVYLLAPAFLALPTLPALGITFAAAVALYFIRV